MQSVWPGSAADGRLLFRLRFRDEGSGRLTCCQRDRHPQRSSHEVAAVDAVDLPRDPGGGIGEGKPSRYIWGSLLQRVIYHYWYHTGENMAIRQTLGHTGLPEFVGDIDAEAPYRPE